MQELKVSLNLQGYDTTNYEKNPVVTFNFDDVGLPIAKARIAEDKQSIYLRFPPKGMMPFADKVRKQANYDVKRSYMEAKKASECPVLVGLSIVPRGLIDD